VGHPGRSARPGRAAAQARAAAPAGRTTRRRRQRSAESTTTERVAVSGKKTHTFRRAIQGVTLSAEAPQLDPVAIRPVGEQDEELHELFERYARPLERFCLRELGNREEAEDAVQTTFLNAFRAFRRGVRPELEAAWLYAIAANVCRSRRRSFFRRRRVEVDDDLHALEDVIAAPQALETEMLIGLGEALASMPESQRTAILLREWQGLSYAEIAREMNLTNGAVETLIFRARRALAKGLEEEPSRRKKIAGGINVGSLLTALKGLLGGAGAAKLAAAGTVAVVATFAAQPLVHHLTPPGAPAVPESPVPVPPVTPGTTGRGAEVQRNMTPPATALRTGPTRTLTLAGTKTADARAARAKPHATADLRTGVGTDASSSTASAGVADSDVTAGTTRPAPAGGHARTHPTGGGSVGRANAGKGGSSGTVPPTSKGNGMRGNAQNPTPPGQAKKPVTPPGQARTPASQQKQTGSGPAAGNTSGKDTGTGNKAATAATNASAAPDAAPAASGGDGTSTDAPADAGTGGADTSSSAAANNGAHANAGAGSNAVANANASGHGKP
jgi:RNA polymerase sigma-70 factor (ECF subfamily)